MSRFGGRGASHHGNLRSAYPKMITLSTERLDQREKRDGKRVRLGFSRSPGWCCFGADLLAHFRMSALHRVVEPVFEGIALRSARQHPWRHGGYSVENFEIGKIPDPGAAG